MISIARASFTSKFAGVMGQAAAAESTLEIWEKNETAAASASQAAHFADAEKLLIANQQLAQTFPAKDARLPRTLFDLAQVYRAQGKYAKALPVYERVFEIYKKLYGEESVELADTLDGEAELYKSLEDYGHAEPLLIQALAIRQKLLPAEDTDIAQSKNDLGEVYVRTGSLRPNRSSTMHYRSEKRRARKPRPWQKR